MNILKVCNNYWHTGSRQELFCGLQCPCCLCHCQEEKENWKYIIRCPSWDSIYHHDDSWSKVKKAIAVWCLKTNFWLTVEKILRYVQSNPTEAPTHPKYHSAQQLIQDKSSSRSIQITNINKMDQHIQRLIINTLASIHQCPTHIKKHQITSRGMGS
jgi:hypothetical protein